LSRTCDWEISFTRCSDLYLVFVTLIIAALATLQSRRPVSLSYVVGVVGYGPGLLLAAPLDLPTGPLIVLTLAPAGARRIEVE